MRPLLLLVVLLAGCAPVTAAQHTRNLRWGLQMGIASCYLYELDQSLPRDAKLDTYCPDIVAKPEGLQ